LQELTSTQLSEWEAFNQLEPIGEWRSDFRASFLATVVTNIAKSVWGKKGAKMSKVDDFLFKWGEQELEQEYNEPKEQTMEEMEQAVHAIARAFGGDKKNKPSKIVPKNRVKPRRKRNIE